MVTQEEFAMADQEKTIQYLESRFPAISGSAFAVACMAALASGQSVLQSDNGVIYEVFSDGTRNPVKKIEPPTPVVTGSKIMIR